jgi:hypothetical protein
MRNLSLRNGLFLAALIAISFLTSCSEKKMKPVDVAIHRVIEKTVQDVNHLNIDNKYYLIGVGGSIDHKTGKQKTIDITFQLNSPLSKEACRWVIVNIALLFLSNINQDPDLSQFLPEGGFTYNNLDIGISLLTPNRSFLYHPDIAYVSLFNGKIYYSTNDPKDKDGGHSPYKERVHEPFEEALKIVESQGRPKELESKPSS